MNYFYLLMFLLNFTFCFPTLSALDNSETEAGAPATDSLTNSDFCCKREMNTDSAHDMSEQKAEQITKSILAQDRQSPKPQSRSGQR